MDFQGTYRGQPVQGVMLAGSVATNSPDAEDALRNAVAAAMPVYILGVADEIAAFDEGPAGYATVVTILDAGSVAFDQPLVVEDLPDGAVS